MDAELITSVALESRYPQLEFCIKGPRQTTWVDGYPVQLPKHIVLQFDRYICVLEDMANEQEWTDEDKEFVTNAIDAHLKKPSFTDFWIHEAPKPGKPWPTYDDTHHNQVPIVAQATGMVREALVYEERGRPGGPRESVVKKLSELLEASDKGDPTVSEDELAAA